MAFRIPIAAVAAALGVPAMAAAGGGGAALAPPVWTGLPFVALLLAIALLPLAAERFWHRNRNKALVGALTQDAATPGSLCRDRHRRAVRRQR